MLAWISLLGFAGGVGAPTPTPTPEPEGRKRRGAPRKSYWWENGFHLPPRRRIEKEDEKDEGERLPHEAAIEDAREALAEARKVRAASDAELRRLAGQFGGIVRNAKEIEKRIDQATNILEVEQQYRELGVALQVYLVRLDELRARKISRLRADDDAVASIFWKLDL
jgi:hypothetical protein